MQTSVFGGRTLRTLLHSRLGSLVPLTFGPSEEEPLLYATCAIYRLGASPSITPPLIYSWTSMLPLRVSNLGTSEVLWSCVDTLFPRGLGFCLILSPFGRRWVRFLLSPFSLRDRRPVWPLQRSAAAGVTAALHCDLVRLCEHFLIDSTRYIRYEHRLRPWESLPRASNFSQTTLSRRALIEPGQVVTSTLLMKMIGHRLRHCMDTANVQ